MKPEILAEAEKYRQIIYDASQTSGVFRASLIAAIIYRESLFGLALTPPGPGGTGDFAKRGPNKRLPGDDKGWGRGLMQIDYQWHEFARISNWMDPRENIFYGTQLLRGFYNAFFGDATIPKQLILPATLAAYNSGPGNVRKALKRGLDVDTYTAHADYSKEVLRRAQAFFDDGWV